MDDCDSKSIARYPRASDAKNDALVLNRQRDQIEPRRDALREVYRLSISPSETVHALRTLDKVRMPAREFSRIARFWAGRRMMEQLQSRELQVRVRGDVLVIEIVRAKLAFLPQAWRIPMRAKEAALHIQIVPHEGTSELRVEIVSTKPSSHVNTLFYAYLFNTFSAILMLLMSEAKPILLVSCIIMLLPSVFFVLSMRSFRQASRRDAHELISRVQGIIGPYLVGDTGCLPYRERQVDEGRTPKQLRS